jgi:hypothetical protein
MKILADKSIWILITSLFILFGNTGNVFAKNCPSQLSANLNQVGEKELYWGVELRLVQYFLQETDNSLIPAETSIHNAGYPAVRAAVDYTLSDDLDWLNFYFEGEVKARKQMNNCNKWTITTENGLEIIPQLRGASVSIDKWDLNIKIGRQNLVYGTQAILDNYFDAITIKKKISKNISLEVFTGIFAIEMTRETLGCGYEAYYEHRRSWKRLCSSNYGDYLAFGAIAKFKHFKPHKISLMNIFQWARNDGDEFDVTAEYPENLTTNFLSLYAMGPFLGSSTISYETEIMAAYRVELMEIIPAVSMGLRYRIPIGKGKLILNPRYAGSFTDSRSKSHFASVFEGYDLGARQRYGLYDGQIWSFMAKYHYGNFRFHGGYHFHTGINTTQSIDDEIEAGFTWFVWGKSKYQLRAIYSALNVAAGNLPISHGARFVARLIF